MRSHRFIPVALLFAANAWAGSPPPLAADVDAFLQGTFDNAAQSGGTPADAEHAIPHVTITIERTPQPLWSLWHVHIATDPQTSYDQTWAMETRGAPDGGIELVPYYEFRQTSVPTAAAFDPGQWLSLEACALRGSFGKTKIHAMSEGEPCVAVSMGVGARRALLPVGLDRDADMLHVDMNLRGVRTRIDARHMK